MQSTSVFETVTAELLLVFETGTIFLRGSETEIFIVRTVIQPGEAAERSGERKSQEKQRKRGTEKPRNPREGGTENPKQ